MDLSVVIPVKNEADNVAPLVGEIRAALEGLIEYEILYVDDGSDDATSSEISRLACTAPQVRLLRHSRNYGQSAAISTGVHAARGAWIATLDGDGQNDPADLPAMWHLARQASPSPPLLMPVTARGGGTAGRNAPLRVSPMRSAPDFSGIVRRTQAAG